MPCSLCVSSKPENDGGSDADGYPGTIDQRVNKVMAAMHAEPGRDWNVTELAKLSNLSRSAFAEHYHRIVGQSPMAYLTTERLDRAAELLRYGRTSVSEIAPRVGYTSEASFGRAFKSGFAMTPLQ